tara:strand:- start:1952 stop:2551 length:600 start_codon:yes stop_codon:yes gene_type:complete
MKFNEKELFYYCNKELRYKKINKIKIIVPTLSLLIIFLLLVWGTNSKTKNNDILSLPTFESNITVVNINDTLNDFSEEKLIELLLSLNVKFPHIVLAQAKLESGHYSSKIYKENHNLFGMKEAVVRIHTSKGTQFSHAYYDNWRESVYDYAFYQSSYLSTLKTEEEYYVYLDKSYAEADNYVKLLKSMVITEKLKEQFF